LAVADPHVVEPAPQRMRPPIWLSGLVGLAAAAAVAFYVAPTQVGPVDGQIPAEVASAEVTVPLVVPLVDGPGLTLQPESIVAKETVTAADGTETRVAVLTSGGLSFERHDGVVPEVDEVRWGRLPLVAHPVGTVFDARAIGDVALIQVRDGRVDLRDTDGTALRAVNVGEIALVREAGDSLVHVDVTHWDPESVRTLGPEGLALYEAVKKLRFDALSQEQKALIEKEARR
jgi:ferric-dicitrate binding protein FerR (iron transport regulator)